MDCCDVGQVITIFIIVVVLGGLFMSPIGQDAWQFVVNPKARTIYREGEKRER